MIQIIDQLIIKVDVYKNATGQHFVAEVIEDDEIMYIPVHDLQNICNEISSYVSRLLSVSEYDYNRLCKQIHG